MYRGVCGMGQFFDSVNERCATADPEMCNPGPLAGISSLPNSYFTGYRRNQNFERLRVEMKGPRVVCYVTSWALYRKGDGKFVPEQLDTRLCTDVVYSFAGLNPDTLEIQLFDPWADIDNSKSRNK